MSLTKYIDPANSSEKCDDKRRDFLTMSALSLAGVGLTVAAYPIVDSLNPSSDVLALSSVEVDVSKLEPGQELKVMWRGKPVFIRRRTKEDIDAADSVNITELKDPQSDDQRTKSGMKEWLVVIGVCTHLGCVPKGNGSGEYNGWFCPCHGSEYDTSGRIRKGPAPTNLSIPSYEFVSEHVIKIG